MKKIVYDRFGGPELLRLADVATPEPGRGEVLVRVRAAGLNPVDWKMHRGEVKILTGWRFPQGLGMEFAGTIEKVGGGVTGYRPGDAVFGAGKQCLAEYVIAKPAKIAKMPEGISFEAAATLPVVGITAASLFDKVTIGPGTRVLINGATGGIGMFATQMAVARGAEVTAVVSAKGMDAARRWGVARLVDYRQTDVLREGLRYDIVLDLSDKLTLAKAKPILTARGTYLSSLPVPSQILGGLMNNLISRQKYALIGKGAGTAGLQALAAEVASGRIEVLIGSALPLDQYATAYANLASGAILGKALLVANGERTLTGRSFSPEEIVAKALAEEEKTS